MGLIYFEGTMRWLHRVKRLQHRYEGDAINSCNMRDTYVRTYCNIQAMLPRPIPLTLSFPSVSGVSIEQEENRKKMRIEENR